MVTTEKVPPYLYRYRSVSGKALDHLQDILLNDRIWFTSPAAVNDPFDCHVLIDFEGSDDEWRAYFKEVFERTMSHAKPSERARQLWRTTNLKRYRDFHALEAMTADLQRDVDATGLLCLTERCEDLLMWSHYAEGHTGVCLRFRHSRYEPFIGRALHVTYAPHYPKPRFNEDSQSMIEAILLTKCDCWSYELEWRIIDHNSGAGLQSFPASCLTGLIFGCRTPVEVKKQVAGWCASRRVPLELFVAHRRESEYGLEFATYKDGD